MKRLIMLLILMIFYFAKTSSIQAWTGEPWISESRSEIEQIAMDMINLQWVPNKTIINLMYYDDILRKNITYTYYPFCSIDKFGMAYSQHNPQENLAEFKNLVSNTQGGNVGYGADCSGYVSMAWKLPTRYDTSSFEIDALNSGGYVMSLGAKGTGRNVGLQVGDALVDVTPGQKHIVLVKQVTKDYIWTMEETPNKAQRIQRPWKYFETYRPIRRNNLK